MFRRPGVQSGGEGADQRAEFSALLRLPLPGLLRNTGGAHPAIATQIFIAVELGAAATCLGIQPHEQLGVALHLREAICVKQAWMIGREDVRDAVSVPENFGALLGNGGGARRSAGRNQGQRYDKSDASAKRKPACKLGHGASLESAALYTVVTARGQA